MGWFLLVLAGLFEVGWAIGLKYTDGLTRPLPALLTLGSLVISLALLGLALKSLPLGTAYAVWTGIGTVGTVVFGVLFLGDLVSTARLLSIGLILAGIAGLKLAT